MATSTLFCKILCEGFLCLIFVGLICAQVNNQFPDDGVFQRQGSSFFFYQNPKYPRDCSEVLDSCSSSAASGVYLIKPDGYIEPFEAYCDNDIDSGGWTTILRRFDGSVDFNRNWNDYKKGFGFLSTEFWLGNGKFSSLTNQAVYELRIDITLNNGTSCDIKYNAFRISDEWSNYSITTVGTYERDEACKWKEESECATLNACNATDVSTNFTDCTDVYNTGHRQDGVYFIRPAGWEGSPFKVFCNMSIDGGSWNVFQRRVNGSTSFIRSWDQYKEGFGDMQHEFWLGNEKLHHLTQQATYEYRVDFVRLSTSYHNKYSNFHIDNESEKYRLTEVGFRTGTGGYSFFNISNTAFSTYDQDNDGQSYNCAEGHQSGWWHGAYFFTYSYSYCCYFLSGDTNVICLYANLNGDYKGGSGENIFDRHSFSCNIRFTEMKIRRTSPI